MSQIKLSDIREVLLSGAQGLRDLVAEISEQREAHYAAEKEKRASRILDDAEHRGLDLSQYTGTAEEREEKVAALIERTDIDVLERAIGVAAKDLGFAHVGDDGPGNASSGEQAFWEGLSELGI